MMIFTENLDVKPEYLFNIIEKLIDMDAEVHWLTRKELYTQMLNPDLCEVWFYDENIGHIKINRIQDQRVRVGVWLNPLHTKGDNGDSIMQTLASGIRLNINGNDQFNVGPIEQDLDLAKWKEIIRVLLLWKPGASIVKIGHEVGISTATVKRDLKFLEDEKIIKR